MKGCVGIRRLDVKYTGMGVINCRKHSEGGSIHKANQKQGLTLRRVARMCQKSAMPKWRKVAEKPKVA